MSEGWENHVAYLTITSYEGLYRKAVEIVNNFNHTFHHDMIDDLESFVKYLQDDPKIFKDHITTHRINFYELALDFIKQPAEVHKDDLEKLQVREKWLKEMSE